MNIDKDNKCGTSKLGDVSILNIIDVFGTLQNHLMIYPYSKLTKRNEINTLKENLVLNHSVTKIEKKKSSAKQRYFRSKQ